MVHPIRFSYTEKERGVLYAAEFDTYRDRLECGRLAELVGKHTLENRGIGLDLALSVRITPTLSAYVGVPYEYRRVYATPSFGTVTLEEELYEGYGYYIDSDTVWESFSRGSEYAYNIQFHTGLTRRSAPSLPVWKLFVPMTGQLLDVEVYHGYRYQDEWRDFYDEYGLYKLTGISAEQMKKACVPWRFITDLELYSRLDLIRNHDDEYRYLELDWQFIPRVVVAKHLIVPLFDVHGSTWGVWYRGEEYLDEDPDRKFIFLPWLGLQFARHDWGLSATFDQRDFLRSFEIVFWKSW